MDTCVLVYFIFCSPFNKYTTPVVGNIARFCNDPIANKHWPSIADTDTLSIVPPVNVASLNYISGPLSVSVSLFSVNNCLWTIN